MHGFIYRLFPPRPTFAADMTPGEQAVLAAHVTYWTEHAHAGTVIAFGPVADLERPHGIAVLLADNRLAAERLRDNDPAVLSPHGFCTDISPMLHLVTPNGSYAAAQV